MFKLTSDLDATLRRLDNMTARQLPFALSRALNDTAKDIQEAERKEMQRVFDRPTPYTLGAFMVRPATKENLVATVERKDQVVGKHYLEVEEKGGPRPATSLEKLLRSRLAYSGIIQAILPADNARLDQYGNWSSGQRNEVLSAIGAMRDSTSNRTARSLKRKKNPSKFFVPTSGLPGGVYERTAAGQLKIILAFTAKAPTYTPRFNFGEVAQTVAKANLPVWFDLRMQEAIASAR